MKPSKEDLEARCVALEEASEHLLALSSLTHDPEKGSARLYVGKKLKELADKIRVEVAEKA